MGRKGREPGERMRIRRVGENRSAMCATFLSMGLR